MARQDGGNRKQLYLLAVLGAVVVVLVGGLSVMISTDVAEPVVVTEARRPQPDQTTPATSIPRPEIRKEPKRPAVKHQQEQQTSRSMVARPPVGPTQGSSATTQGSSAIDRSTVLNGYDLMQSDPKAIVAIQLGLARDPTIRQRWHECLQTFTDRGYDIGPMVQWNMLLDIRSAGGRASIDIVDSDDWPEVFDSQIKSCFLDSFRGLQFESNHEFHYSVEFPMRFFGPPPAPPAQ